MLIPRKLNREVILENRQNRPQPFRQEKSSNVALQEYEQRDRPLRLPGFCAILLLYRQRTVNLEN